VAGEAESEVPSPAKGLQRRLDVSLNAPTEEDEEPRWTIRSTLLVCGGVSVLLWVAIAAAIMAVSR
jgi:hypothetical protein